MLGAILTIWLLGTFIVTDILEINLRQKIFAENLIDKFLRKVYNLLWVVFGLFVVAYIFIKSCNFHSFFLTLIMLIIFLIYWDARKSLKQLHEKLGVYLQIELTMKKKQENIDNII